MSLINDALKRAKEAQGRAPAPPSTQMQFRPVEPAQRARHGLGLLLPAALAFAAVLALFCVWQWAQERTSAEPREARARTPRAAPAATPSPPVAPSSAAVAEAAQASSPTEPSPRPDAVTEVANLIPVAAPTTPASPPLVQEQESSDTSSAATASPPLPKPTPLRLQAIVFNPKRPSVLINGKTLFVGEKLGDARVVAIDQESATLVGGGKTTVLTLGE